MSFPPSSSRLRRFNPPHNAPAPMPDWSPPQASGAGFHRTKPALRGEYDVAARASHEAVRIPKLAAPPVGPLARARWWRLSPDDRTALGMWVGEPTMSHRLAGLLTDAAAGRFPRPDGGVTILPAASVRDAGVIGFTAHAVIFIDAEPAWVESQLPAGDLSGPLTLSFLYALCQHTRRRAHSIDILCVADPLPGRAGIGLTPEADPGHPRITRPRHYRDDVRAWRADGGPRRQLPVVRAGARRFKSGRGYE